jgi:hypothetical protein
MKKFARTLLAAAALLAGGSAQAAWTNLSFESGTTGWCSGAGCNGDFTRTFVTPNVLPKFGSSFAGMATIRGNATMEQIGGLLGAGTTLWYRFTTQDYGNGSGQGSDWLQIQYLLGGQWLNVFGGNGQLTSKGQNSPDSGWLSFNLAGASGLRFTFHGDNDTKYSQGYFDITPGAPVPEPGEWAMLLAGLGMVGVIARRRKFAA